MLNEPIPRLVSRMAVPTTVIQIISIVYNTADTYFVSHIDKSAAAAVGVCFSLMSAIQAIGLGIGMGAGSLISRELGAKKEKEAGKNANSALAAVVLLSVILSVLGSLDIKGLMRILGSSDSMLVYSCDYARYILISFPIMCTSLVLNIILRAEGYAKYAMLGISSGGILNLLLDPLFILKFNMGISGAAIATGLSQTVSCVILLVPFLTNKTVIRLSVKSISRTPADYFLILTTGTPTICRQGLAGFASALLNRRARLYGDAAIAAVTIANKIYLLIRNIILGIGQGLQPVAGYNFGAGDMERMRKAFNFACLAGTVVFTLSAVIIFFNAESLIAWFQPDSEVVSIGKGALWYACAAMPTMAYSTYVGQLYQCLGYRKTATVIACCRQGIMFLPPILILPALIGLSGVQAVQPLADVLSFFFCIPFHMLFFKNSNRVNKA